MPEQAGRIESISGPGSLMEYCDVMAGYFKESTISYQLRLNELEAGKGHYAPKDKQAIQGIIDREKNKYVSFIEAQNHLRQGDNSKALALLHEQQEELKRRVAHNIEHHNWEWAEEANTMLVVFQMLEADATGVKPLAYGMRLRMNEPFALSESVKKTDLVIASLFKTVFLFERNKELNSGMMYRPSAKGILQSFDQILDYDVAKRILTDQERERAKKQVADIYTAIERFSNDHLRAGNDRSYPNAPYKGMRPHEIMQLRKPQPLSSTPNALVYVENNGELKYRLSADEKRTKQVFDLEQNNDGLEVGTIVTIEPLPQDIEDKIAILLNSPDFKAHWYAVQKNWNAVQRDGELFTVKTNRELFL